VINSVSLEDVNAFQEHNDRNNRPQVGFRLQAG
jgi:hypothetical protein